MRALIANSRGPESEAEIAAELGPHIIPATVDRALDADIIFFAAGFLHFKEVAAKRPDWTGKIVIDVTNAFLLPAEIQQSELHGRLSSEVNAERVPGAKPVKAFNQLPMRALIAPLPDATGRRVFSLRATTRMPAPKSAACQSSWTLLQFRSARLPKAVGSFRRERP
jgi:predicted dinucleotide-binding enzyme